MRRALDQEKFEIWEKELSVQFVPDPEDLKSAIQFGREFAQKVIKRSD
jgi:flavorubredoxin